MVAILEYGLYQNFLLKTFSKITIKFSDFSKHWIDKEG